MGNNYIKWFEDDELSIEFSENPHVCIRYILPSSTPEEIKSIKKYPFINKRALGVRLYDKEKENIYDFTIHKGECFNGADIPKFFWRLIGARTDNAFLIPSIIHDKLCNEHHLIDNDRHFSSLVFRALLIAGGISKIKAQTMYLAVDNFQRFCNW